MINDGRDDDNEDADDFDGDKDENNTLLALIVILLPFTSFLILDLHKQTRK